LTEQNIFDIFGKSGVKIQILARRALAQMPDGVSQNQELTGEMFYFMVKQSFVLIYACLWKFHQCMSLLICTNQWLSLRFERYAQH